MARPLDDWRRALKSPEALAALMKEEERAKEGKADKPQSTLPAPRR